MVELTRATAKTGVGECIGAVTDTDNLPTYIGVGVGLVGGNVIAKMVEKLYTDNTAAPNDIVRFVARTLGRLGTSAAYCAVGGGMEPGAAKDVMQMGAVASSGMTVIDLAKVLAPAQYQEYLTLQEVRAYKPQPVRTALQPQARVAPVQLPSAPVSAPSGGIVGDKPQDAFSSSRVSGK